MGGSGPLQGRRLMANPPSPLIPALRYATSIAPLTPSRGWTAVGGSLIDGAPAKEPWPVAPPLRAWVAQLVEQRIENPRVGGSNPPPGTTVQATLDLRPMWLK